MLITLEDVGPADRDRVGGKALNCARLRKAGFPVPDGLVVAAGASDQDIGGVTAHPWFGQWPAGQRFAVRSSGIGEDGADQSFAGVHETQLNVERAGVADAVRACIASTTSVTARAYRASHGLSGDARTGVLIQPMVDADTAGVAFTVHPVTGANELVVDAAPGLGDALVSGRIQPDHYRLRKDDLTVLERTIEPGRPPVSDDRLRALGSWLLRAEAHYQAPQDVEWALAGGDVWLLQSRPVTGARVPGGVDIEWTRANLAEVTPEQASPQALYAYEELLNAAQRKFMGGLLAPEDELGPGFKVFGGRMYFNLSQLCHLARFAGAPPAAAMRSLGHPEAIRPEDEVTSRLPVATVLRALPHLLHVAWLDLRAPRLVRQLDRDNAVLTARLSADPAALDDRAILALLAEWKRSGPDHMVVVLVHGGVMRIEEQIRRACRRVGADYDRLVYAQLAVGAPSVSTQQAFDLVELADVARRDPAAASYFSDPAPRVEDYRARLAGSRFLDAFDRFLEVYGHRGLYESDWALPRYREDPTPLLFAIRMHVTNPPAESRAAIAARLQRDAADAWAEFDGRLTWWQRLTVRPRVRALIATLKQRYVSREYCRSELVKVLYHARQLQLALASRFVARGWIDRLDDYFLLLAPEIERVVDGSTDPAGLRAIVHTRTRQREVEGTLAMPLLMRQSEVERVLAGLPAAAAAAPAESGAEAGSRLTGLCVSRGAVEAEVVVIRDPREFSLMRRGAILVAPATDPSWTPLFTLAAGVIVEVGGILSHASTVAREYGLPALANVRQATVRLRTGDRVRLDASAGVAVRL